MSQDDVGAMPRGLGLTSLSPAFRDDPFTILNRLRDEAPVFEDGQLRDHIVSTAALAHQVLSDPELLVDPRTVAPSSTRRLRGEDLTVEPSMLHSDGDRHKRLRTLMLKAFSKQRLEAFRARTRTICETLFQAIEGQREFDFIERIARPMPTIVITELLGVDPSQHADFKVWSDRIIADKLNPLADAETRRLGSEASLAISRTVAGEVGRRLDSGERPDDLISGLMDARTGEGERYTVAEICQQAELLLIAGNQTTTDLMGTMVKNLMERQDSYRRLVEDPGLIRNAIEEALRFEPPIFSTERVVQQDTDIGGLCVPKGHVIAVMLTAANHDPGLANDPEVFDIRRSNIKHYAFGGGAHRCIGAPLAKMECEALLDVMTVRFPTLRAADRTAIYDTSPGFRGLSSYWLRQT